MDLKARLQDEMKTAMKAQDSAKVATLRMAISEIKKKEIDRRVTLDEPEIIKTLQSMIKQRNDSIEAFEKGGRTDLADKEKAEIAVLKAYMPQQMSRAEMEELVAAVIKDTGAQTAKDFGKVMKELSARSQGRADGKVLNEIAKSKLPAA